jgi:hypothetical protein
VLGWILVYCGTQSNPTLRAECSLLLAGVMTLLTLPSGILWVIAINGIGYVLFWAGIEIPSSLLVDILVWLGFVVIGYFQWFRLVPLVIRRFRNRKQATA